MIDNSRRYFWRRRLAVVATGTGTLKLLLPCKDLRGEALMVAKHGQWDHTFDFSFSVAWEAKVRPFLF
jgi:hypothetical protein